MFTITSPLAVLVAFCVAALVASAIARWSPYYRKLVGSSASRLAPLDGLRGYLAFGVFLHHSLCNHTFLTTNGWGLPPDVIYLFLGGGCVSLFFMTSAFLFWSRTVDGAITPANLYVSRFFRIMPLYFATMLALWFTVWMAVKGRTISDPVTLVRESVLWLFGGFFSTWTYNSVNTVPFNAGVTWTLLYEWWFYLSLPLLSVFASTRRFAFGFVLFFVCRNYSQKYFPEFYMGFLHGSGFALGMLAVYLVRIERLKVLLARRWAALWALAHLAATLWYNHVNQQSPLSWEIVVFPLFLVVACGNTIFSMLTRPWSLLLGHLSYSVYLVHGLVLYYLVQFAIGRIAVIRMSPVQYWGWISLAVAPVVVLVATITYRFIEAPFLARASLRRPRKPQGDETEVVQAVSGPTMAAEA